MKTRLVIASLCATLVSTLASLPAQAAPCAGFVDVDDSSAFCHNVEWIKNRFVTLGCDPGVYCPNEYVSRAAMAAFLHRLGSALSTRVEVNSQPFGFFDLDGTNTKICQQNISGATVSWPRRAHGRAILHAFGQTGAADISARFIESTDGGTTWIDASPLHAVTATDGINTKVTLSLLLPPRDHIPLTSYQYAVRIGRFPGSTTTGDIGDLRCAIAIEVENRNSATSPFDADE